MKTRRLHVGRGYSFNSGHRDPNRKLHYLGTVKNAPYKGNKKGYRPARIFACGTKEEIEGRRMITIVEVPIGLTRGTDGKIAARPEQCNILEYGNYVQLYHGSDEGRKQIAPIEELLVKAGFPNKSVKPTPTDPAILAQIGPISVTKKGA